MRNLARIAASAFCANKASKAQTRTKELKFAIRRQKRQNQFKSSTKRARSSPKSNCAQRCQFARGIAQLSFFISIIFHAFVVLLHQTLRSKREMKKAKRLFSAQTNFNSERFFSPSIKFRFLRRALRFKVCCQNSLHLAHKCKQIAVCKRKNSELKTKQASDCRSSALSPKQAAEVCLFARQVYKAELKSQRRNKSAIRGAFYCLQIRDFISLVFVEACVALALATRAKLKLAKQTNSRVKKRKNKAQDRQSGAKSVATCAALF